MVNKYCTLVGGNKIKDEYTKITLGFQSVEADVNLLTTNMSSANGLITAANARIDNIVNNPNPNKDLELVDARNGYATLRDKLFGIVVDVKDFGAKGDGVTDDYAAIQAAIDYAVANAIYIVYLPAGTYIISQALVMVELVGLRGAGRYSTYIYKNNNGLSTHPNYLTIDAIIILHMTPGYYRGYAEHQSIRDIYLKGNRTEYVETNSQYAVYSNVDCPFLIMDNFRISNVDNCIYLHASWHSTFKNCLVSGYARNLYISSECQGIRVWDFDCFQSHVAAIDLSGSTYNELCAVNCEYVYGDGLRLQWGKYFVAGCAVEQSFGTAEEGNPEPGNASVARCVYVYKADVTMHGSFFDANPYKAGYRTFYVREGSLEVKTTSIGYSSSNLTSKGKLFELAYGGKISIDDTTTVACDFEEKSVVGGTTYATAGNAAYWGKVKQVDNNIFIGEYVEGKPFTDHIDNVQPKFISKKITLDNKYTPMLPEGGTSRANDEPYNKGDWALINNPLKSGHAAWINPAQRKTEYAADGKVTNVSGSDITVSSLTITDMPINNSEMYVNLYLKSSSGATGRISAIDTNTKVITLSSVKGAWLIDDTITAITRTFLGTVSSVVSTIITMTDLTLDSYAIDGALPYKNMKIKSSSSGATSSTISSIDYDAKTIILTLVPDTDTWKVGDIVTIDTATYLKEDGWAVVPTIHSGPTQYRPTDNLITGQQYFDTTIGKPVYWTGSKFTTVNAPSEYHEIFDDFDYQTLVEANSPWILHKGTDAQALDPAVSAGKLVLTTGDNSGTYADDGSQVICAVPFQANTGELMIEARLKINTAITGVSVNFGFTDTNTFEEPFSLGGSSPTLIANCSDGACFVYDDGSIVNKNWFACSSDFNPAAQPPVASLEKGDTGVAPTADTYQTLTIRLTTAGAPLHFYINGVWVKSLQWIGVSPDVPLYATVTANSTTTASKVVEVDYIKIKSLR